VNKQDGTYMVQFVQRAVDLHEVGFKKHFQLFNIRLNIGRTFTDSLCIIITIFFLPEYSHTGKIKTKIMCVK